MLESFLAEFRGAIVYRLGFEIFILARGVRLPLALFQFGSTVPLGAVLFCLPRLF